MKKIYLRGKNADKFTIVDDNDYDYLNQFKWSVSGNGYAQGQIPSVERKNRIYMHRAVGNMMGLDYRMVDHINRNKLDNTRENLRNVDNGLNVYNTGVRSDNSSGYRGVSWNRANRCWRARLWKGGKCILCKIAKTKEDAAKFYNDKARELYGDDAFINIT